MEDVKYTFIEDGRDVLDTSTPEEKSKNDTSSYRLPSDVDMSCYNRKYIREMTRKMLKKRGRGYTTPRYKMRGKKKIDMLKR